MPPLIVQSDRLPSGTKVIRFKDTRVPLPLIYGRYEALTDEQIEDIISDLQHEVTRRGDEQAWLQRVMESRDN